jgi:putative transposase
MEQSTMRKTSTDKLMPTPTHEQALATVVRRCCTLYKCALDQRKTWWGRGQGIGVSSYQQATELPDRKAACPQYGEVQSQIVQDVLRRIDKTYQAFFWRGKTGEMPGYPRLQGRGRSTSRTSPQYGNGAVLNSGVRSLSKIGRSRIRLHRPLQGIPKTAILSREADGWDAGFSCAEVPTEPLPLTGKETGIDVGLTVCVVTTDGKRVEHPRYHRKAEQGLKHKARTEVCLTLEAGQQTLVESRGAVYNDAPEGQAPAE